MRQLNQRMQRRPRPASVPRLPRRRHRTGPRCTCVAYPCGFQLGVTGPGLGCLGCPVC